MNAAPLATEQHRQGTTARWLLPPDGQASRVRAYCEALIPPALLLAQLALVPLSSPHFPTVAIVLSAFVALYAVAGLTLFEDSSRRWQLTPPWWYDSNDYAYGFVVIVMVFLAGIGPISAMRYFDVPMPNPGSPWLYLAWCLIQDFIFFSLILRSLVDLVRPYAAIAFTAALFGLSHFPNYELVFGTMIIAAAWGYLFLASRWLLFVVVSHWLMGLLLLSR